MLRVLSDTLVVPECFYLPIEMMDDERKHPGSQYWYPVNPIENGHFLWANAIYIITMLLSEFTLFPMDTFLSIGEHLIHSSELDPIYRHVPSSQRPKNHNRYSAFQGSMEGANPVVQVALIAESSRLQMMLSTYGISTQTPHEIEPVQIWSSYRMVKVIEE